MAGRKKMARMMVCRLLLTLSLSALCAGRAAAQETLWKTYLDAGMQAFSEKDYAAAEKRFTLALKEVRNFGAKDERLAFTLLHFALLGAELGRLDDARSHYEQALAIWGDSPKVKPEWVTLIQRLGDIYKSKNDYAGAESAVQLAISKLKQATGAEQKMLYSSLGDTYYRQDKLAEASSAYSRVMGLMEKYPGPEDFDIAVSLFRLGGAYEAQSKHAEAEPLYKRVLVIVRQRLGPQNVAVVSVLTTTGDNYVAQKKFAEAERSYKEALEIQDKLATHDAATIANLLEKYAALLRETERGAEAAKFEARAEALRAKKTKGTVKEN